MIGELILYLVIAVIFTILITAAVAGFRAAPYVPTFQKDVVRLLESAAVRPDELVVDLGAGDGRFLITAAKRFGARGIGYELSLLMFIIAWVRVQLSGQRSRVRIRYGDFFRVPLDRADVICCFLTPPAMRKLEPIFGSSCKSGARVASYAFRLPNRPPSVVSKPESRATPIFIYRY